MQDRTFYKEIFDSVKLFFNQRFEIDLSENIFTLLEVISWVAILFLLDSILRAIFIPIVKKIIKYTENDWINFLYNNHVFKSIIHLIPITLAISINPILFRQGVSLLFLIQKTTESLFLIVFTQVLFRIINSIIDVYNKENSYITVGVRTFGQMLKFIITFFSLISGIMILFTVNPNTIITILGALTAAVLLIFRDAIFGFVSGLQISYSKIVKVGDWITISKGNVEGIVKEININLVKVQRSDKSVTTVPTVDLVSSQVTNHMTMIATGTKQLKKIIIFNANSFKVCDENLLNSLEKINLISEYIKEKRKNINNTNTNYSDFNHDNLINIVVFRVYIENYLRSLKTVSSQDSIIIKQLPFSVNGMPLEINCFLYTTNDIEFEKNQADIFYHLLTACRKFDLEITQNVSITDITKK